MKGINVKNIFSSGLQAIALQVLGVFFLFIISYYLSKDDFGLISWSNAVSTMITTLLALGMEQVVIRRIAASGRSDWAAAAFLVHAVISSIILLAILSAIALFTTAPTFRLLPFLFLVQALVYIGTPLKQYLNAKQYFAPYGIIACISNLIKIIVAYLLMRADALTIQTAIVIMIVCGLGEVIALYIYIRRKIGFSLKFKTSAYQKLIRESAPQYISTIFDVSLSRLDWVLLGIIGTHAMTAEYSIAYRAFEIARLPITVIAPILLTSLAKVFVNGDGLDLSQKNNLARLFTIEIFVAILIVLVLNILWVPVMDTAFHGKYGANNAWEFLILSMNIPFLFCVNLLWTICFAGKVYKKVARLTIISAVINLVLNLVLIPLYGGKGAAAAFLATTVLQYIFYHVLVSRHFLKVPAYSMVMLILIAGAAYYISGVISALPVIKLAIAIVLYVMMSILFRQVNKEHLNALKVFLKR